MTLMNNITIKYVVSSYARVRLVCAQTSLLCLLTTHDAAGSGQIGGAEMKKHREVSSLVTWSKAERSVMVFVAAA